jgi:YfiH family protein
MRALRCGAAGAKRDVAAGKGSAMLTADVFSGVRHGFFGRAGGVSRGLYASLNCGLGSGDDPGRVAANRARAADRLGLPAPALVTLRQVHSADVLVVDAPLPDGARPQADGLVTRREGLALGILTADCAPVLLADTAAGVIGAAHAGWRGAKAGVLGRTIGTMTGLGAKSHRIAAAVGPCIGRASYEVGPEFRAAFVADDAAAADLFAPSDRVDHFHFNLAEYVRRQLAGLGVGAIAVVEADTCADEERFFSFRRATLRGERDYGRQLSAIAFGA